MQKPNQPDYILMSYKIPYYLQDGCLNEYVYYQQCMRHNPHIFENRLIHSLPFAGALSNCSKSKQVFNQVPKNISSSAKNTGSESYLRTCGESTWRACAKARSNE